MEEPANQTSKAKVDAKAPKKGTQQAASAPITATATVPTTKPAEEEKPAKPALVPWTADSVCLFTSRVVWVDVHLGHEETVVGPDTGRRTKASRH